jgi:hypothetical protein
VWELRSPALSPLDLIHESDVAGLGVDDFQKVLNRLLSLEASIHRIPERDVDLTLRKNDPDGGVDARVKWPSSVQHGILVPGENVLQYKTGKVGAATVTKEFRKPGVQACLKGGGSYCLLVGQGCNPTKVAKLRKHLADLCKRKNIRKDRCQILAASHIARWISHHPAVITMRELGKVLPGFCTVESWAQGAEFRNQWKPDSQRTEVQSRSKELLQAAPPDPVIRIEGPTGVGKTRLALECVKSAGMADRAIYAPNSEDQNVGQLLSVLWNDPQAHAIVVADECDRDRHGVFKSYAELAQGRLRLICVGPGDSLFQSPAEYRHLFAITPMNDEDMRAVLSAEVGQVPPEVTEVAVRLAGGYPKLAFFVARAVLLDKSLTANEIRGIWDIRGFLKKFLAKETAEALGALSLFERLGWEGDLQNEARVVAEYLSIPFTDLKKGIKTLKDQGVVIARGRYLCVTPELLAIDAAANLWETRGTELVGIIDKLPEVHPRREFLKRLAAMGRHTEVRKVVERLLGSDGLYRSLGDLDDEFRGEAFRILASALPDAATRVLARLIEPASRDALLSFKIGRRNVIWSIETLLRWPATSLSAARSLRALALAETEHIANNATGVFVDYFQVHLSRSPIPFIERMQLVDELLASNDDASRLLAVRAARAGLSSHETRMGGDVDELAKRPYPPEWRPVTYGDIWAARRAALKRLQQVATGSDSAAQAAKKAQIDSTFTLMNEGMFDDLIGTLRTVKPDTDQERRAMLDACIRAEVEFGDRLSDLQKGELAAVRASIFDASYFGRLKRWVGRRLHADYQRGGGEPYPQADAMLVPLADEGFEKGISDDELAWLASKEAENVWAFGLHLGEIDSGSRFLERIVSFSSENFNSVFLAAYLAGRGRAEGEELRETLIDQLADAHPLMAFGCTWRGNTSDSGFRRIVRLVEAGGVPPLAIGMLVYGAWAKTLPPNDVVALVRLLLGGEKAEALEPAMSMIGQLLERLPEAIVEVEPLVWEILESTPPNASVTSEWDWGQLANKVAARDPQRMARLIVRQFSSVGYVHASNERHQALQIATQTDPVGAWQIISEALLPLRHSFNLLEAVRRWYGELIPFDHLVSWAKAHQPDGPRIVAGLIAPCRGQISQHGRALIQAFPNNEEVIDVILSSPFTGAFVGPISAKLERDLAALEALEEDPDPAIRSQVRKHIEGRREILRRARIEEEERGF